MKASPLKCVVYVSLRSEYNHFAKLGTQLPTTNSFVYLMLLLS